MKNKPMSGCAWRGITLLLCLCLACLSLLGLAQAEDGNEEGGGSEVIIDIVPAEESGGEIAEQPETPIEPVQPEPPPEAPSEPEQPDVSIEPEQPGVPDETELPDMSDETEPPDVPDETGQPDMPDETKQPDVPDETEPPDETKPPDETNPPDDTPPPIAPDPTFTISILRPSGWYIEKASVTIRVVDENRTHWKRVEVKIEKNGGWADLTDNLAETDTTTIEISENCTIYVTVIDMNDQAHTQSAYIECFDREAPSVRAGIVGELLRVEASDTLSGVEAVYINGYRFTGLVNGTLNVPLKDYADEYEQMSIVAVDFAGNKSETVQVKNPYSNHNGNCPDDCDCRHTPTPSPTPKPTPKPTKRPNSGGGGGGSGSGGGGGGGSSSRKTPTPTATPTPAPTISPERTEITIEPGTGFSENGNSVTRDLLYDKYTNKQFIVVTSKDGSTFYMVIDYDKPIDESGENYETYFLNLVDNADLMALIGDGQIPVPEVCACTERCVAGNVNMACPVCKHSMGDCVGREAEPEPVAPEPETPPEEPRSSSAGVILVVLLLAAIGGAAVWYFKFRKPQDDAKGKNAFEDYGFDDDDDEEYESEDTEQEAPAGEGQDETNDLLHRQPL